MNRALILVVTLCACQALIGDEPAVLREADDRVDKDVEVPVNPCDGVDDGTALRCGWGIADDGTTRSATIICRGGKEYAEFCNISHSCQPDDETGELGCRGDTCNQFDHPPQCMPYGGYFYCDTMGRPTFVGCGAVCIDNPNAPRDADGDPHLCENRCDPKSFTVQCNGEGAIAYCDKDGRVQNHRCASNERCGFPGVCWPLLPDETRCNGNGLNNVPVCQNQTDYGYCDWNGRWQVQACPEGRECVNAGGGHAWCRPTAPTTAPAIAAEATSSTDSDR